MPPKSLEPPISADAAPLPPMKPGMSGSLLRSGDDLRLL